MRCMAVIRQDSAQSLVLVEKKNYNYNAVILTQSHSITECLVGSSALTTLKTQIIQTMMVEGRQDFAFMDSDKVSQLNMVTKK